MKLFKIYFFLFIKLILYPRVFLFLIKKDLKSLMYNEYTYSENGYSFYIQSDRITVSKNNQNHNTYYDDLKGGKTIVDLLNTSMSVVDYLVDKSNLEKLNLEYIADKIKTQLERLETTYTLSPIIDGVFTFKAVIDVDPYEYNKIKDDLVRIKENLIYDNIDILFSSQLVTDVVNIEKTVYGNSLYIKNDYWQRPKFIFVLEYSSESLKLSNKSFPLIRKQRLSDIDFDELNFETSILPDRTSSKIIHYPIKNIFNLKQGECIKIKNGIDPNELNNRLIEVISSLG